MANRTRPHGAWTVNVLAAFHTPHPVAHTSPAGPAARQVLFTPCLFLFTIPPPSDTPVTVQPEWKAGSDRRLLRLTVTEPKRDPEIRVHRAGKRRGRGGGVDMVRWFARSELGQGTYQPKYRTSQMYYLP